MKVGGDISSDPKQQKADQIIMYILKPAVFENCCALAH